MNTDKNQLKPDKSVIVPKYDILLHGGGAGGEGFAIAVVIFVIILIFSK